MESVGRDFDFKIDLTDNTQSIKENNPNENRKSRAIKCNQEGNKIYNKESSEKNITENKQFSTTQPSLSKKDSSVAQSLTSIVEQAISESSLSESINLKGEEIVSSTNCIKRLKVEGRVSREFQTELNQLQLDIYERLSIKLGPNFNKEQFWLVECGLQVGDKYQTLEAYNSSSQPREIIHEPGTLLIIDFWSYWSDIDSYLNNRVETMMKIEEGKVEGVHLDKIKTFSISGEENFKIWNKISNKELLNKYIPQYHSELIYHLVGVEKIPSIMIVNKEGVISYLGTYREVDLEKSIQNLLKDKAVVLNNLDETANYESNPNSWWIVLDNESKIDIVREINTQLRQMGSFFSSFAVITYSNHLKNNIKNVTIPMFLGTVCEKEYEDVQGLAIELQNSWNFNDFKFNVKIMNYY